MKTDTEKIRKALKDFEGGVITEDTFKHLVFINASINIVLAWASKLIRELDELE